LLGPTEEIKMTPVGTCELQLSVVSGPNANPYQGIYQPTCMITGKVGACVMTLRGFGRVRFHNVGLSEVVMKMTEVAQDDTTFGYSQTGCGVPNNHRLIAKGESKLLAEFTGGGAANVSIV
jgi:hypothetical protein